MAWLLNSNSTIQLHGCSRPTSRTSQRFACGKHQQSQQCNSHTSSSIAGISCRVRHCRPARLPKSSTATAVLAAAGAPVSASETNSGPRDLSFSSVTDGKSSEELELLARQWGYEQVGRPFPSSVTTETLERQLPSETMQLNPLLFAFAVGKAVAVYGACVWASFALDPSLVTWLAPALWFIMGTAFTGLFAVASDCAHYVGLPITWMSEVFGAMVMSAALYPYITWRLHYTGHILRPCTLDYDQRAWRPLTTSDAERLSGWARFANKLFMCTPFKLLASLGHWLRSWDGLDLRTYHSNNRAAVLAGWIPPALFAGYVLPELITRVGFGGLCNIWLMPMLVFHFWLSSLSLVAHTGPHIPWRNYGEQWDEGQVVVNGTVTLQLPRWIEWLLNDINYRLPAQVSLAVPCYRLREAHDALQQSLGPYLTLAKPNWTLFKNLIDKWQVYDESSETYTPLGEPLFTDQEVAKLQGGLDRVVPREQQEQLRQRTAAAQQQAQEALLRAVPREKQEQMQRSVQAASERAASTATSQLAAAMRMVQNITEPKNPKPQA